MTQFEEEVVYIFLSHLYPEYRWHSCHWPLASTGDSETATKRVGKSPFRSSATRARASFTFSLASQIAVFFASNYATSAGVINPYMHILIIWNVSLILPFVNCIPLNIQIFLYERVAIIYIKRWINFSIITIIFIIDCNKIFFCKIIRIAFDIFAY